MEKLLLLKDQTVVLWDYGITGVPCGTRANAARVCGCCGMRIAEAGESGYTIKKEIGRIAYADLSGREE
jgi:hypothetical protein